MKFPIELRAEASEYVEAETRKLGTTRAGIVRKALNVYAALNDERVDVIVHDRNTGDNTRLIIG